MPTGSVISFKDDKGYGFIRPKDATQNSDNVYVHITTLQAAGLETLKPGQRVSFEFQDNDNGKVSAVDIKILE